MTSRGFFDAVQTGDLARVEALLDGDPSLISARNENGASAILVSVYSGRQEVRDLLLSRAGQLEIYDAVAAGQLDRVKQLVDGNPPLANAFSRDGFPVLALACFFGHLDVARYLANKGAQVNAVATNGTGYNAMTAAVTAGHTEIVRWLLENRADPNHRYGPGYSPLLAAAANGHLEIVKLLLAHGADPYATTTDGKSALIIATERNHSAVAAALRDAAKSVAAR